MRALLDVNVLVALFDPEHSFHERAHAVWNQVTVEGGWASCPIIQNGVLRILSNEGYPGGAKFTKADVFERFSGLITNSDHQFWADEISLLDERRFNPKALFGWRHLTDIYLLGLAMHNNGHFVTFDQRIPCSALVQPTDKNLWIV